MTAAPELARRSFLSILTALGLPFATRAQTHSWLAGLQLYTVRAPLGADIDGVLRRVAEIGYREVELAGLAGSTAPVMRDGLKRYGLSVPSMHAGYDRLRRDLDGTLEEAQTLGVAFIVCPSIDHSERRTADDWKRVCQTLGRIGRTVRNHGFALAYHNHDYEFVPFEGGSAPFDLLIRETDPRDVKLEIDVHWVAKGRRDPVRCLQDNEGRVPLVHLKDLARDGSTAELGAGVLDMEQIIRSALSAGARHLFVEQDSSPDPLRSIGTSFRFLESLPADVRPRSRLSP